MFDTNIHMRILIAIFLSCFLFITQPVFAEEFVVTHVGAVATQGKKLNQWWYEPQRVILKGTGSRGANIDVTLDGKFNVTKANVDNGAWQFDLGTLSVADHNVIVASGDQSYSFILTIGSSPPADMSSGNSKGGLPAAGSIIPLAGIIGIAGALIFYGFKKRDV